MRRLCLLTSVILAGAYLSSGCISISSFQTARTQKKDEASGFFGVGYESLVIPKKSSDELVSEFQEEIEEIKVPILEGGMRYGLTDSLDIGIRYTVPGTLAGEVKYQLTGHDSNLATAIGFGLGTGGYSSGTTNYDIFDIIVPLWISQDFTDTFSAYLSPRMINRSTTFEFEETRTDPVTNVETKSKTTDKESALFIGATVGIAFYWFVAEVGYFTVPGAQTQTGITQFMIGYWGGWDETSRKSAQRFDAPSADEEKPRKSKRKKRIAPKK